MPFLFLPFYIETESDYNLSSPLESPFSSGIIREKVFHLKTLRERYQLKDCEFYEYEVMWKSIYAVSGQKMI